MFNAARLTLARQRRALSKKTLAQSVGITSRMLRAYEGGTNVPSEKTLERIAVELNFPISFFMRNDPVTISPENASFRALSRITAAQRDSALAQGALAIELSLWLEEHFYLPEMCVPDLRELDESDKAARRVRSEWGLGERPVLNMVHLLESKGVRVFSLSLDCVEVDAFSVWWGGIPYVFLNPQKTSERSRFDAAHELGHLVLHRHISMAGREEEKEANRFAASFLMPRSGLLASVSHSPSPSGMLEGKRFWGVSMVAYAARLHELRLLSEWNYRQMCMKWRNHEAFSGARETSQLLDKAFRQLRSEGIRRSHVAEKLSIFASDVDAIVFGLILSSIDGGGSNRRGNSERRHLRLVR